MKRILTPSTRYAAIRAKTASNRFRVDAFERLRFDQLGNADFEEGDGASFEQDFWDGIRRVKESTLRGIEISVLAPTSIFATGYGFGFADSDISILGIGSHRFFAFHSGLAPYAVKKLHQTYLERVSDNETFVTKAVGKIGGVAGAAFAVGVGVHLLTDVFQPKTIIFPGFGSLVDGTLVDDDIWLLGNSAWCFKIARDFLVISCSKELEAAKAFVKRNFEELRAFEPEASS